MYLNFLWWPSDSIFFKESILENSLELDSSSEFLVVLRLTVYRDSLEILRVGGLEILRVGRREQSLLW